MYLKKIICIGIVMLMASAVPMSASTRQKLATGWSFRLEKAESPSQGRLQSWHPVVLPHDWSILSGFDVKAAPGNDGGYLPAGKGRYRTTLNVNGKDGRRRQLYFEGVYMNAKVYVNGKEAGGHPYGYSSFFVDLTPYLKKGKNEIEVVVDNSRQKNCRWYSGSGIYRNVWLLTSEPVSIVPQSIVVTTPDLRTVNVSAMIDNFSDKPRRVQLSVDIDGLRKFGEYTVPANTQDFPAVIHITKPDAVSWSPNRPKLYTAKVSLSENGKIIDREDVKFGFRTISFDADMGFLLNDSSLLINGACVHHDNGILGAAAWPGVERRKARLLKEAGFNAVRTSHNPPSEDFLNACDEYGLLVIDEAFDGWREAKTEHDYHELIDDWWAEDITSMIKRDRNHPSVISWSIGNEIIERKKIESVTTARRMARLCRELDPTRPVTSALASWDSDWEIYDPLAEEHDIVGYNYMIHKAESDHERAPKRIMWQTESYPADAWKNFRMVNDHRYVIGDFVWTGLDYLGESGIGRWYYEGDTPGEHYERPLYPWHAAYCGDIDLTGHRKPISHYRSMIWNEDENLFMAVREPDGYKGKIRTTLWGTWPTFESWNWKGHEGKPIEVEIYSTSPVVRLYKDGKLVGEKNTEEMKATFEVTYSPGILRAEALENGIVTAEKVLKTSGDIMDLRLQVEGCGFNADPQTVAFITIEAVDAAGNPVTDADNLIDISVTGPAELVGFGNADIKDPDPYYDGRHRLWHGRALAAVRSTGKKGTAFVTLGTNRLPSKKITLEFK